MPLLPYVYGSWTAIAGESWYALRLLSALLALATGGLLYVLATRRLGDPRHGLVAVVCYAGSALVFGYFTIVKTFALATFLLLVAYALAERTRGSRSWIGVGLALALAIDTRLLFAAAVPAFAGAAGKRRLAPLASGLAVGLVPTFVFLALSPREFFFDNLRYHAEKTGSGLVGDWTEKAKTLANLVGIEPTDRPLGLQFLLLGAAALAATTVLARRGRPPTLAFWLALLLGAASILPTPSYVQYFSVAVPFLVLAALELAPSLPGAVLAVALVPYLALGAVDVRRYTETSPLLKPSIASVRAVSRAVEAQTAPGEVVLSSWPGYLFGTHARPVASYTNHFAPAAAAKLSPAEARRYRLASEPELERLIRERAVPVVVFRNWVTTPPFATWAHALAVGRYRLVAEVETARIYRR